MEKVQKGTAKIITGLDNMPDVKHTRSSLQLMKKAAGRFVCSLITYRRKKKKKRLKLAKLARRSMRV